MTTTANLEDKYDQVLASYCFYIDVQDKSIAKTLSKRIEDLGLRLEVFLTRRVSHVIRDVVQPPAPARWISREGTRTRADAMLQRVRTEPAVAPQPERTYHVITIQRAVSLLDKVYDTFFSAPRKTNVRPFTKEFIKIEFLDKIWRPVYKEFDEWPLISLVPDPPRYPSVPYDLNLNTIKIGQKMTRKSRPRLKERSEREAKGGYCEMCNAEFSDAELHRRAPRHAAFVRDARNYLALDSLIADAKVDVASFLPAPRPMLNGHATRPGTRARDDHHYYKVIGVSTKLRSSGTFPPKKEARPVNGTTKPLVVKFRKVRRSELSVLSDEAEQFMFPKRAGSTSSGEEEEAEEKPKVPEPPPERRRLARPGALKEESSEEDSWPEDERRRRRKIAPVVKKVRRFPARMLPPPTPAREEPEEEPPPPPAPAADAGEEGVGERVSPPPAGASCVSWLSGALRYPPAVEQLEFAFERVPRSEPWFQTFRRQDERRACVRDVPSYFALYRKSPKLPYEIGTLPPLKEKCCPLSELVRRDEKVGPSRSYGTRGMKKQKLKKRTLALLALESHPRKSPREHASTLAMLGSAGSKRRNGDDAKSTASEETVSETLHRLEPVKTETQQESERLQQFLSEVFEDASDYDLSDEIAAGDGSVATSTAPDILSLVSESEKCEIIRDDIRERVPPPKQKGRRGKFKKKNRTGWPQKKKTKKSDSRTNSTEANSVNESSTHDDTTQDSISEGEESAAVVKSENSSCATDDDDKPLKAKQNGPTTIKEEDKTSASETEEERVKPKKRRTQPSTSAVGDWLQPIVRVARVDPNAGRKLRSAAVGRNRKNQKR